MQIDFGTIFQRTYRNSRIFRRSRSTCTRNSRMLRSDVTIWFIINLIYINLWFSFFWNLIQYIFSISQYFVLPSLTDEGYRVTILRLKDSAIDKFSIQTISRRILMVLDTRLIEEQCLSNIMVIDLEVIAK